MVFSLYVVVALMFLSQALLYFTVVHANILTSNMMNVVWKETHLTVKYIVLLFNTVKASEGIVNSEHCSSTTNFFQ